MSSDNPNACLSGNECTSTPGTDTQVVVTISPYFPVHVFKSLANNGRSWLGASGSSGDYGHNRGNGTRSHAGCDIYVSAQGESVYAVKSGTIVDSSNAPSVGWGNTEWIAVDHGEYIIRYCEISDLSKKSGKVHQGEELGKVKTTSFAPNQAMLHLEMYDKTCSGSFDISKDKPADSKYVNGRPTFRRKDLIDPTMYLEKWVGNLPPGD